MLYLLKLGGSLITDKNKPHSARPDVIRRMATEIRTAMQQRPDLKLIIGHGSGSFGHVSAHRHNTRNGVHTPVDWQGFLEVWRDARDLNIILTDEFSRAGLPVISFPPSAGVVTAGVNHVQSWDVSPIRHALDHHLIPVVQGDVAFDALQGGTIISTEEVFTYLCGQFEVGAVLIAGIEDGVWQDYPTCTLLVKKITPSMLSGQTIQLAGSAATDVTGGMLEKVNLLTGMANRQPGLQGQIFSGLVPGQLTRVLLGETPGTIICGE